MSSFESLTFHKADVFHGEVLIGGHKSQLEQLRDAIDKALEQGEEEIKMFDCDGEQYDIRIEMLTD